MFITADTFNGIRVVDFTGHTDDFCEVNWVSQETFRDLLPDLEEGDLFGTVVEPEDALVAELKEEYGIHGNI